MFRYYLSGVLSNDLSIFLLFGLCDFVNSDNSVLGGGKSVGLSGTEMS